MIPGMANAMGAQGTGEGTNDRVKSFMCMMDSMTNKELDSTNPKIFEVLLCRPPPHPRTCCEMEQPAGVCLRLHGLPSLREAPTPEILDCTSRFVMHMRCFYTLQMIRPPEQCIVGISGCAAGSRSNMHPVNYITALFSSNSGQSGRSDASLPVLHLCLCWMDNPGTISISRDQSAEFPWCRSRRGSAALRWARGAPSTRCSCCWCSISI